MLDPGYIYGNVDAIKANCRNRNVTVDIERVVELLTDRKKILQELQLAQQRQNEISKLVAKEKEGGRKGM